jgi:outer membrane biosynthesis protein TonB
MQTEPCAKSSGIPWREPIVAHWQQSMRKAGLHAMVIVFQTCEVTMDSEHASRYSARFEPRRPVSFSENLLPGDPLHAVKTPGKPPGKQPPPIKPPGPKRPPVKPPKPDDPPVQPPDPGKPPVQPPDPGRPPVKPPEDPSRSASITGVRVFSVNSRCRPRINYHPQSGWYEESPRRGLVRYSPVNRICS